ncbi:MAG: response regulator transcription factor [Zavarzinia sp.]|nr:response regulator transcription factor [Zavarzinia sp.]
MRLLLLEDEDTLADLVAAGLGQAGFIVDRSASLAEAAEMAEQFSYDAMVFDRGLPDGDALGLLRSLRRRRDTTPVLLLTARETVEDRIEGLNTGADDYLVKPFALTELVARLRALLRRPAQSISPLLSLGNLVFDPDARVATADGRPVALSPLEASALEILLRKPEKVIRRGQLEHGLYDAGTIIGSNSIEVLMHRLRRKLELAGSDCLIVTVRGLGYLLRPVS